MLVELETIREKLKSFLAENYDFISPTVVDKAFKAISLELISYKDVFKDEYRPKLNIGDTVWYICQGLVRKDTIMHILVRDQHDIVCYELVDNHGGYMIESELFETKQEAINHLNSKNYDFVKR